MTVKDKVGRTRYVAFRLDGGPLSRGAMSGALPGTAKLTRFDGTYGIVRTGHREVEGVVAHLRGVSKIGGREVRVETLGTSGTIRKAAEGLPGGSSANKRTREKKR